MTTKLKINLTLKHTFGNILRQRHVLIALQNQQGEILLGHKPDFYPQDIYRLIGGGIDEGEEVITAAVREIKEEIGLEVFKSDLKLIGKVEITARVEGQTFDLVTYIFT